MQTIIRSEFKASTLESLLIHLNQSTNPNPHRDWGSLHEQALLWGWGGLPIHHPGPMPHPTALGPPRQLSKHPQVLWGHQNCFPWGLTSAPLCLPKIMPKLLAHGARLTFCSHPGKGQEQLRGHRDPSAALSSDQPKCRSAQQAASLRAATGTRAHKPEACVCLLAALALTFSPRPHQRCQQHLPPPASQANQ